MANPLTQCNLIFKIASKEKKTDLVKNTYTAAF